MIAFMLLFLSVAIVLFALYFMRTSKEMPKNLRELSLEFRFQFHGTIGYFADVFTLFKNKVALIKRTGKVAVLTGGNRGIGIHVLEKLLKCDMIVILGVRKPDESQKMIENVLGVELTQGKVFYVKCDTGDIESVIEFAEVVQQKCPAIHVLINNAGVLCTPYQESRDGFESQMAINYLGHFLLTHLLMPQLIAGSRSNEGRNVRIVNVSSCAHKAADIDYEDFHCKKFYYPADSYCKSKLAQVLFSKSLDRLCREKRIKVQVHAVHPGIVDTEIFRNTNSDNFPWIKRILFKTPEQGSRAIVDAAISPKHEGKGGSYLTNCIKFWCHKSADDVVECSTLFKFTCDLLKIQDFGTLNETN